MASSQGASSVEAEGVGVKPAQENSVMDRELGATLSLPIAAYSFTASEAALLRDAENLTTKKCMARYGVEYSAISAISDQDSPADRRYGISSFNEAKKYGYHMPSTPSFEEESVSDEARALLYGTVTSGKFRGQDVPVNGCAGEGVERLRVKEQSQRGARAAGMIAKKSFIESMESVPVREAMRVWSICMSGKGYRYESPLEAMGDQKFLGDGVSAAEKRTARADLECKDESSLPEIWFVSESGVQQRMIEENLELLDELQESHDLRLRLARKLLSSPS
ncbi:hypothetical protein [Streptomyces sp. OUCMDZ-3434]|uniref:hypothetical protein n=1 Tax=Streptomyces sp. OUCMDZ-3434 TaxID=1535304 RepID=UPI001E3BEA13|nr:hypothetical protein [Streptomyces sp. OUCMDZ-3434]